MKKLLIALSIILACSTAEAQVRTPQASPKAIIKQTVGLTDVEIVYSRPGARGRAVFGNLVPFGKLWRTGANENTIISFSDDVMIDGKTLKKGKYALYTIPKIESWEVIFYTATDNWGLPENWNEANFWNTLNDTGFTQEDVLNLNWNEFSQKFIDLNWPWEHIEKLADILLALDAKQPNAVLKERAKNIYQFIQSNSKIFSFEIVAKINKIK